MKNNLSNLLFITVENVKKVNFDNLLIIENNLIIMIIWFIILF